MAALSYVSASPIDSKIDTIKKLFARDAFAWTALGDSYSSGVGAGDYTANSYRCLRYSKAYPNLINEDKRLHDGEHTFQNVVCSGSKTQDVLDWQLLDDDTSGKPNWQYGTRPKFGSPSVGTLSIGGNDIDFPGIIFNCIIEYNPGGIVGTKRTCDEQRKFTQSRLDDPKVVDDIAKVIEAIVKKARKGPVGDKFKLYVTGFPQFFSEKTNECDKVTFARDQKPEGHQLMTQERRKEYNAMSVQLNKIIASAVDKKKDMGVFWVPIDQEMEGHRFCEPGIKEPDQKNDKLWLFHYPYAEAEDSQLNDPLQQAEKKLALADSKNMLTVDYQNAVLDETMKQGNSTAQGIWDPFFRRLGIRVKVFHPQIPLHEKIRDLVLDQYTKDAAPTSSPPKNECHGVSGDYWVMSRDVAVDNAKDFCGQKEKEVTYNKGSVNELSLSVKNTQDDSKGPGDAPDCLGRFTGGVIDGCDGSDPVNNPHNYKFGSTFSQDGWEYTMKPLSKQVNEVSCDVSYKFLWDNIEIRGKNLPDAKLGADGEGLKKELEGCGALTEWKFELTPNDVKFQWYAAGRLPIGTKDCVGDALVTAGGSGEGNCHGAGKRSAASIDDWPGYGDDSKHVFGQDGGKNKRASIDEWPGYGDDSKHVFGQGGAN